MASAQKRVASKKEERSSIIHGNFANGPRSTGSLSNSIVSNASRLSIDFDRIKLEPASYPSATNGSSVSLGRQILTATTDGSSSSSSSSYSNRPVSASTESSFLRRLVYTAPPNYGQQGQQGGGAQQTRIGSGGGGGVGNSVSRVQKIVTEVEEYNSLFGEETAQFILETREKERRELHELNDRLAAYLERMRMLELQNKDLDNLKQRWQEDVTSIKKIYEKELSDSLRDLEDTSKSRAYLDAQIAKLQGELDDMRRKFEDALRSRDDSKAKLDALIRQLGEAENEINNLRRRVQSLEEEIGRLRNENNRLQAELQKAKSDLDRESMKGIEYQNQIQALLKKIDSMRRGFEQEVNELRSREVTVINADQYKSDLANAIREIRREFDQLADHNKKDLESWYVKKVHEVQTTETNQYKDEASRMKNELDAVRNKIMDLEALNARLNREIHDLEGQLQNEKNQYESTLTISETHIKKMLVENRSLQDKLKALYETNQNLYAEIAIYRKLLDNEEGHLAGLLKYAGGADGISSGLSRAGAESGYRPDSGIGSRSRSPGQYGRPLTSSSGTYLNREETSSQSNLQRSSKGSIQFGDISPEGKFITLENISTSRDENLGDWKIVRLLDNKSEKVFTFPQNFVLGAGRGVRVWARNQGGGTNYVDSFVHEGDDTWGTGSNVVTLLYNRDGEERASCTQLTPGQVSNL